MLAINSAHNIREFELGSMLIIMFSGLMDSEKGNGVLRVVCTIWANIFYPQETIMS
jgi:hypothetical protein